ncbi:MAG: zinc ribbon domain-containing protein [Caldilineaceae bacterium]
MTSTFGCPHCGRTNAINARFCAYCGMVFEDVQSSFGAQDDDDPDLRRVDDSTSAEPSFDAMSPAGDAEAAETSSKAGEDTAPTPPSDEKTAQPLRSVLSPPPQPDMPEKSDADLAMEEELAAWLDHFPPVTTPPPLGIDDDLRRQLRQMFASEVPLVDAPPAPNPGDGIGLWRRSWIYWLLTAMLVAALWWADDAPEALPHPWPGIAPVYDVVESMPTGATVLVDWSYDPATAGEMDLAARPVIEHLLARNANLVVISQLPLGPATARRVIAAAGDTGFATTRRLETSLVEGGFLPGGAATLSLLGQSPGVGVPLDLQGRSAQIRPSLETLAESGPVLSLVVSAQSEPVQRWLEQVQPLDGVPVIAVTSAAAGPVLRPYVDSGQLVGMVSGYNGGVGYRELLLRALPRAEQDRLLRQISGHNWALAALLIVIVAANVALSFERRSP